MLNLNTTYPIKADGPIEALPVLVDLNWFGSVMTSDNAGIVPSRSAYLQTESDNCEVIL